MHAKYHLPRQFFSFAIIISVLASLAGDLTPVSAATVRFASPTGVDSGDCPYTAPCSLQFAVQVGIEGQSVYAAAGTYHSPYNQVLFIDRSLRLYGGWDGVSGPNPILDPKSNETILDGQNTRGGMTLILESTEQVILSGLTVRNGNTTDKSGVCTESDQSGCGGGIFVSGGLVTIEDSILEDNVATTTSYTDHTTGYGGGIYIQSPTSVVIRDNIIRSNDASTATTGPEGYNGFGGGIYITGSASPEDLLILISNNEISENEVAANTGDFSGVGAGLAVVFGKGVIRDNSFFNNDVNTRSSGAAIYAGNSDLSITGNLVLDNHGSAALSLTNFNGSLDANIIDNPDVSFGVSINVGSASRSSRLTNNIIAHHVMANVLFSGGSGFPVTAVMNFNTLDGGEFGIYLLNYTTLTLTTSIISHNTMQGVNINGTNNHISAAFVLFENHDSDSYLDENLAPFYGDPLFVDAANRDYHLQSGSIARDKAPDFETFVDFEGDPRPMSWGSVTLPCDIGADEYGWRLLIPMLTHP